MNADADLAAQEPLNGSGAGVERVRGVDGKIPVGAAEQEMAARFDDAEELLRPLRSDVMVIRPPRRVAIGRADMLQHAEAEHQIE